MKAINPAVDIPLPGGYVMPTVRPPFDFTTLIRVIMIDQLRKSYSNTNTNPNIDYDSLYATPQLIPGKISQDALLQFTDDYMVPALRIAERVYRFDDWRVQNLNNLPPNTTPMDISSAADTMAAAAVEIASSKVSSFTRQKLQKLITFLKARNYGMKVTSFSDIISYIEFEPRRALKNRREFFPSISIMVTPSQSYVFDVFIGGERVNTFEYGMPTYNQIVAPPSMLSDNFDGTLSDKEFYQYRIGLEQAVFKVETTVKEARAKVIRTKDPKVKAIVR